jgi:imidazole glycerol-phosphate synthase subunit HisF
MSLTRRVIACLDVAGARVVKGIGFRRLRDIGDPVALAERYEAEGADELVFLDIGATPDGRALTLELLRRTAERLFIPLTVGGGIRSADDAGRALRAGADKVAVNTAAVLRPGLISDAAGRFGSQCVVASIDAVAAGDGWRVATHGGRTETGLDAVEWARECVARGAGEILLTSVDRDGTRQGYDVALTRTVAEAVPVPVVASGGAGSPADVCEAFTHGGAEAALVAGVLHDGTVTIREIKEAMMAARLEVRWPE